MEEKDFIQMEPALENISKRLIADEKKQYIDCFNEIKTQFLEALRAEDPIFNYYKKTLLVDEKIKIKGSYEFDVNICLKLPFNPTQMILENGLSRGFVTMRIPGQLDLLKKSPQWENFKSIDLWMDKDDYVLQIKLREWMSKVSRRAIDALKKSSNVIWSKYEVEMKQSGPSIILTVTHRQCRIKLSVNFYPVLELNQSIWPSCVPKKYATEFLTDEWYAAPGGESSCDQAVAAKLWWISFPQQENNMLKGKQRLRITQRLIELLRENREFIFIKSYVIKSVFMLMVEQKKSDSSFWQKNLSYLFMVMLTDLYDKVSKGCVPFFWDRNYNMLSLMKPNQLNNCRQSLQGSIRFIMKNFTENDKILNHLMPARICISIENGLNIKPNDEFIINLDGKNCLKSKQESDIEFDEKNDTKLDKENVVKSNNELVELNGENDMRLNEKLDVKLKEEKKDNEKSDRNHDIKPSDVITSEKF